MEEGGGIMAALDGDSSAQRDENLLESKHAIFLSHSGAQKSFVDQLCLDIERHDRYAFFDKRRSSLSIGCNFPDSIFQAIKQCQVAVVVLSEHFFTRSKWPMVELASLVKRKCDDPKLVIMPVFLRLTHAQCRDEVNQARWMGVWESWARSDSRIDLKEWQAALKVFGYTNGICLNDELDEVKCRGEIVDAICKEVPPITRWDDSHVQGRSRLCLALRAKIDGMQVSKSNGARILGIYGVGGIGKSTACKVLCNYYFEEFEGKVCHIEFGIGSMLLMLREALKRLTDTNQKPIKNFSEDECKDRLKKGLMKKVFLAIDNVSDRQQIVDEAAGLLRMRFMEGSIVIVTARTLGQLHNLNVEECMEMPELDEDDARSMFLYHAAPRLYIRNGDKLNEQLLNRCIKQCYFGKGDGISHHYHPLALKVLGGQLGNDPEKWTEKLNEVDPFNQYQEVDQEHPIYSILGRSFEILKPEDQFLFMDVAIFCPRRSKSSDMTINIFEWLSMVHGRSPHVIKRRLQSLKDKSLLENLGDGSIQVGMHDLWREFAKRKSKGGEFDSRPWIYEKLYGVNDRRREEPKLPRGSCSERLQRMCMVGDAREGCILKEIDLSCFANLEVMTLVDVYTESKVLDVSSLRQLKSLEILFFHVSANLEIVGLGCLGKLVFLHLDEIQVRTTSLQECLEGLTTLEVLCVGKVYSTAILPDFSRLNLLRDVCFNCFEEGDMVLGLSSRMTHLKRLDFSKCCLLCRCDGVGDLVALEKLDLSDCEMLEELPNLGRLKHLLELDISRCGLIEVVPGFGDLVSLQKFGAEGCRNLAELPEMGKLINLKDLSVLSCSSLKAMSGLSDLVALENLLADFGGLEGCRDLRNLTKLERVTVRGLGAEGLPCLSDLVNLKILTIDYAEELTGLENLTRIEDLGIAYCGFKDVRCLSNLTALKSLHVSYCDKVERFRDMHKLSGLESLTIECCGSLREWESGSGLRLFGVDLYIAGTFPQLRTLCLLFVGFTELPDLSNFPQLWELEIWFCEELTRLTSSAPLTALKRLDLRGCGSLRALPDVSHLVSLSSLSVLGCEQLALENLEAMCPGLKLDKSHFPNRTRLINDGRDTKRVKLIDALSALIAWYSEREVREG